jgi:pSer/pThr/pTyr-binding forkhead associated (FHA) protein
MPPRVRLIESGPTAEETREIAVTEKEFLIGRGADCDLRLPVAAISRHHCIIRVGPDEVSVVDLGSSNGTFINGQRVRSQAVLRGGDQLQLGPCQFLVSLGEPGEDVRRHIPGADPLAKTLRASDLLREREEEK